MDLKDLKNFLLKNIISIHPDTESKTGYVDEVVSPKILQLTDGVRVFAVDDPEHTMRHPFGTSRHNVFLGKVIQLDKKLIDSYEKPGPDAALAKWTLMQHKFLCQDGGYEKEHYFYWGMCMVGGLFLSPFFRDSGRILRKVTAGLVGCTVVFGLNELYTRATLPKRIFTADKSAFESLTESEKKDFIEAYCMPKLSFGLGLNIV